MVMLEKEAYKKRKPRPAGGGKPNRARRG